MEITARTIQSDEDEVGLLKTQWALPVDAHHTHNPKVPHTDGHSDPVHAQVVASQELSGNKVTEETVATTTSMHKDTGMNSLMTCCAPYFSSSSSSSTSSHSPCGCCGLLGSCQEGRDL
ncbi:hypothetical protein E2C01_004691 [Portunus trituberculatus]|uniref:Uncharacterized protein n=1 Tax=Portunus trituberculatus TaxID=210409 RepID=A0A5B7CTN8_PORTR|nr:hypothetical protein [Portunus trituberculatus]